MDFWKGIPIIDDGTPERDFMRRDVSYGYVPRDLEIDPPDMFAPPDDMPLIPESEWDARFDEQEELQSSLQHLWEKADNGKPPVPLYQNGIGYCWSHSSTHAVMMARLAAGMPFKRLSAFMVGAIIKKGADQGGWCGQSAEFIAKVGVCEESFWPEMRRDYRTLDTPKMRENAALHRITEEWRDLTRPIYGQVMTWQQVVSCGFQNQPQAVDFNWWGHSVCGVRPVRIERGSWGLMILNSHRDGFKILRGSKARPDGAVAIRAIRGT